MIHLDVPQYSTAWFTARLGLPTASEAHKLLTPKTLRLSAQSEAYLCRLLAEWLLQTPFEEEVTIWWMEVGRSREEEAVRYFELTTGLTTQECGFCTNDEGTIGCSPDRFVGDDELIEIKCPTAPVHVGYLLAGGVPSDYMLQLQMQLYVTERRAVWWESYYPGLPALLVRVVPDQTMQDALAHALPEFCLKLDYAKSQLQELMP